MPRVRWIVSLVIVIAVTDPVAAQQGKLDVAATAPHPAAVDPPAIGLAISLPPPISATDVAQYGRMLQLADPQKLFLDHLHARYEQEMGELEGEHFPSLMALSRDGGSASLSGPNPHGASLHEKFIKRQAEIRELIVKLDDSFFDQLGSVLSEAQLSLLDRVRQTRERARCFPLYVTIQGAQVDLSKLIGQYELTDQEWNSLDGILLEYESRLTPLFFQLRKSIDGNIAELAWAQSDELFDDNGDPLEQGSPAQRRRAMESEDRIRPVLAREAWLQRSIADANREFFPRILEKLPEQVRPNILAEFRRISYPLVYPDPTDPEPVYDFVLRTSELSAEDAENLTALWQSYRGAYEAKCRLMVTENLRWREQLARTTTSKGYAEHRSKMRALRAERWDQSAAFLKEVREVYWGKLVPESVDAIDAHLRRIETFRDLGESDAYPN